MNVFTPTNQSRIDRILEILDLLEKSMKSNKATNDDAWQLLQPVIDRLSVLVGAGAQESSEASQEVSTAPTVAAVAAAQEAAAKAHEPPAYITIRNLAETASLQDLTYAMAVYLSRIDEELRK